MSDDLVGDYFLFQLPAYTVANLEALERRGLLPAVPKATAPEYGAFVPLFTDSDLARTFLDDAGLAGFGVVELKTLHAVTTLAAELGKVGVGYVGIDVSIRPTPRGQFHPVAEFLADVTASRERE